MDRLTSVDTIEHADGTNHEQVYCFGHLWGPAFFKKGTKDYEEYLAIVKRLAEYETLEEQGKLPCKWISEERPPEVPCYVLLSFDNFSMPLIGRYEEDEEGGAFYIGDDEESCISQDLIVNGWMPLPEPYREDEGEEFKRGYPEEKAGADALDAGMAADIAQAIEYFEDELSQMKVFAEMIAFREKEKKSVEAKSMETALKVLRGIAENGKGQQDSPMCDIAQVKE